MKLFTISGVFKIEIKKTVFGSNLMYKSWIVQVVSVQSEDVLLTWDDDKSQRSLAELARSAKQGEIVKIVNTLLQADVIYSFILQGIRRAA